MPLAGSFEIVCLIIRQSVYVSKTCPAILSPSGIVMNRHQLPRPCDRCYGISSVVYLSDATLRVDVQVQLSPGDYNPITINLP